MNYIIIVILLFCMKLYRNCTSILTHSFYACTIVKISLAAGLACPLYIITITTLNVDF